MFGGVLLKRSIYMALAVSVLAGAAPAAKAASETEKLSVIRKGIAYLQSTQQPSGYWSLPGDEQAATGAAAFALFSQRDKWGENGRAYQAAVDKAILYLLGSANTLEVSTRADGIHVCPNGAASCAGVYWFGNGRSTLRA
jgi:hypothetical protein